MAKTRHQRNRLAKTSARYIVHSQPLPDKDKCQKRGYELRWSEKVSSVIVMVSLASGFTMLTFTVTQTVYKPTLRVTGVFRDLGKLDYTRLASDFCTTAVTAVTNPPYRRSELFHVCCYVPGGCGRVRCERPYLVPRNCNGQNIIFTAAFTAHHRLLQASSTA